MAKPARRRIDHVPLYICALVSLAAISVVILSHVATAGAAHERLGTRISDLMAAIMGLGCLAALYGAGCSTRWLRPGADLRDCYTIQAWAMIPIVMAAATFAVGILFTGPPLERIEVVILLAGICAGLASKAADFWIQTRAITAELAHAVADQRARHEK